MVKLTNQASLNYRAIDFTAQGLLQRGHLDIHAAGADQAKEFIPLLLYIYT